MTSLKHTRIHLHRFLFLPGIAIIIFLLFVPSHVFAAVTVTSFSASWQGNQVVLNWETKSELNNIGFNIFRATSSSGPFNQKINASLIPSQLSAALVGASYSYNDSSAVTSQIYYYKLQSVESNGTTIFYDGIASTAPVMQATATKPAASATAMLQMTATRAPTLPQVTATRTATLPPGTGTPTPLVATSTRTATPFNVSFAGTPSSQTTKSAAAATRPASSATNRSTSERQGGDLPTPTPFQVALALKDTTSTDSPETDTAESTQPDQSNVRTLQLARAGIALVSGALGLGGLLLALGAIYFLTRKYLR